jgi:hypothetical protein
LTGCDADAHCQGDNITTARAKAKPKPKKADVAEHPKVFDHIGLLANEPLGTAELPSI